MLEATHQPQSQQTWSPQHGSCLDHGLTGLLVTVIWNKTKTKVNSHDCVPSRWRQMMTCRRELSFSPDHWYYSSLKYSLVFPSLAHSLLNCDWNALRKLKLCVAMMMYFGFSQFKLRCVQTGPSQLTAEVETSLHPIGPDSQKGLVTSSLLLCPGLLSPPWSLPPVRLLSLSSPSQSQQRTGRSQREILRNSLGHLGQCLVLIVTPDPEPQ